MDSLLLQMKNTTLSYTRQAVPVLCNPLQHVYQIPFMIRDSNLECHFLFRLFVSPGVQKGTLVDLILKSSEGLGCNNIDSLLLQMINTTLSYARQAVLCTPLQHVYQIPFIIRISTCVDFPKPQKGLNKKRINVTEKGKKKYIK